MRRMLAGNFAQDSTVLNIEVNDCSLSLSSLLATKPAGGGQSHDQCSISHHPAGHGLRDSGSL